jgi:hypothetical protein
MAAWDCNDDLFDRQESLGQQREGEGEPGPNEWYDWSQPPSVVSEFHKTLDRLIDRVTGEAA